MCLFTKMLKHRIRLKTPYKTNIGVEDPPTNTPEQNKLLNQLTNWQRHQWSRQGSRLKELRHFTNLVRPHAR